MEVSTQFETMMKQFVGFQSMMQSSLDTLNAVGTWQAGADKVLGELLERADGAATSLAAVSKRVDLTANRVDSNEAWLTLAPAGTPLLIGLKVGDLNLPPGLSSSSSAKDGEPPVVGLGEHCGGVLGPRSQDFDKGMFPLPNPPPLAPIDENTPAYNRSPPFPKMVFSKFDGDYPHFWHDQCEVFFELYAVTSALKTHFATLNFKGAAAM